ncbi:hypothetical protein Acy02nite_46540 [Actinoplanes cyaneus]|uniref:Uncharacterized protein n=1 Tax=Actinoplanes cyaneus TaxID=52696 RepID=A0A919M6Z9_9ACTN|nr:hypothetical protein [Actinoplanes cyaneus]GID66773.1 hypothetical protein Acy02nite_46540 [Actinoplanes cyaneus]
MAGAGRWSAAGAEHDGEAARTGFEMTLTVSGTQEYVVAEALDAKGAVLGSSSAIPVRV